jgi:hypothetical protein
MTAERHEVYILSALGGVGALSHIVGEGISPKS